MPRRAFDLLFSVLAGAAFLAFTLLASSSIAGGDDAYRHVRFAHRLITETRAALSDPWRIAGLWPKPVDVWFGFHLLLAPFTIVVPLIAAAKIVGAALWAASLLTILRLLDRLGAAWRQAWAVLAVSGSAVVLYRATLARPFLLSLLLVLLAIRFTITEQRLALAAVSALHALSYSMFFLPALPAGLYVLARRSRRSLELAAACALGVAGGIAISPYFPENLKFSVFMASTRAGPDLGKILDLPGEIQPLDPWWLAASLPVLIVWAAALIRCAIPAVRRSLPPAHGLLLALSIVAFVISFRAARMFDFFVPSAALFAASVLSPVLRKRRDRALFLFTILFLLCGAGLVPLYRSVRSAPSIDRYRAAAEFLSARDPGALIFDTHWEQYPFLYFWNWKNRYIAGIDPEFLYRADPERARWWTEVSRDQVSDADLLPRIERDFGARYVVVDRELNPRLTAALRNSPAAEVFRDAAISIFESAPGNAVK